MLGRISGLTLNKTSAVGIKLLSYGADSIGYTLSIVYLVVLVSLYGVYRVSRLIRANNLRDNKVYIPELQMTQKGFVFSRFGLILQILTSLFVLWLHVAMVMAIIGHYQDQWPFDLSLDKGSVDWDSFTRVFMSTWVGSILVAIFYRIFRSNSDSFYLRPSSLSVATSVKLSQVLIDENNPEKSLTVLHEELADVKFQPVRHVDFLLRKLAWSDSDGMFVAGSYDPSLIELTRMPKTDGMSTTTAQSQLDKFGRNEISITVPSFWHLIKAELSSGFFLYQIYGGCLLSLYWDYITAGLLCFLLIITSASVKVYIERKEKYFLREMATMHGSVWVKRDSHWTRVTSEELVAGDLICVSDDSFDVCKQITADCVLVSGSAVVDESTLTGETMPVQKYALTVSDDPELPRHILFAGTWLLQSSDAAEGDKPGSVSNGALAVVLRTGGSTRRGDLIKSLLFTETEKTTAYFEFRIALVILTLLAVLNFWVVDSAHSLSMESILPAVTSLVGLISPLLTIALIGGEVRAASRLKTQGIRVKEVEKLTSAGKTNLVIFDKTGTITKSGIEYKGVVPMSSLRLVEGSQAVPVEIGICLALAHSVTRVNGALVGHQVELQMVEATSQCGWKFGNDMRAPIDPAGSVWEVINMFPFSHVSMTMSALVVDRASGRRLVVCKGSFEALRQKCTNINDETVRAGALFAQDGYYVLGLATRLIENDLADITRESIEKNLDFQGFILFKNEIKSDSQSVVEELTRANIGAKIVSGDSVFTATAVARSVGIIPANAKVVIGVLDTKTRLVEWRLADTDSRISEESLASDHSAVLCVSGEVFEILKNETKLELERIKVFGRMSPLQKAEIVDLETSRGANVLMVGDGANDSLALKRASGLAISDLPEANVAAAFATSNQSLNSVVTLLKEARCGMTTSIAGYRFLIAVGLVHTITKTLLYIQCGGFVSGVASLFIDCIQVPVLLYCICSALPEKELSKQQPESSLLGPETVLGVSWTALISVICVAIAEGVLVNADFFVPFVSEAPISSWRERTDSFESALVVVLRLWLYTDIALVYSYGSLHRRSLLINWRLLISWIAFLGLIAYLLFGPMGVPQAAFIVQLTKEAALEASGTVWNKFLFYYERIGGVWYGVTDSIEFSTNFRISLIAVLVLLSMIHHIGYRLGVVGPITRWCREKLGWKEGNCGCFRRRRHKGYKPLGLQMMQVDALDETIVQAREQDSPAAEWELRRTYGRWRAPTEPEYK